MQTLTADMRTLIETEPGKHPDFVPCDDPRLVSKARRSEPIYVPNLVHLLFRLGGPLNVWRLCQDSVPFWAPAEFKYAGVYPQTMDFKAIGVHIQWFAIEAWKPGSPFSLALSGWHPHEHGLFAIFEIPPKWHLGDWKIASVSIWDSYSLSADLDALVAECCDDFVGRLLADKSVRCN
jgi:hypothetical protein